jgi:hypothetical protein
MRERPPKFKANTYYFYGILLVLLFIEFLDQKIRSANINHHFYYFDKDK